MSFSGGLPQQSFNSFMPDIRGLSSTSEHAPMKQRNAVRNRFHTNQMVPDTFSSSFNSEIVPSQCEPCTCWCRKDLAHAEPGAPKSENQAWQVNWHRKSRTQFQIFGTGNQAVKFLRLGIGAEQQGTPCG